MKIDNQFEFFQIVYLKTDKDQSPRMVTRLSVTPNGITYELSCGSSTSWHFADEISIAKDILLTTEG